MWHYLSNDSKKIIRSCRFNTKESSGYRCWLTQKEISEISSEPKTVQKVDQNDMCFRCGRRNHLPENCFLKDSECYTCKQKDYISPQCSQKKSAKSPAKSKPKQPKT